MKTSYLVLIKIVAIMMFVIGQQVSTKLNANPWGAAPNDPYVMCDAERYQCMRRCVNGYVNHLRACTLSETGTHGRETHQRICDRGGAGSGVWCQEALRLQGVVLWCRSSATRRYHQVCKPQCSRTYRRCVLSTDLRNPFETYDEMFDIE